MKWKLTSAAVKHFFWISLNPVIRRSIVREGVAFTLSHHNSSWRWNGRVERNSALIVWVHSKECGFFCASSDRDDASNHKPQGQEWEWESWCVWIGHLHCIGSLLVIGFQFRWWRVCRWWNDIKYYLYWWSCFLEKLSQHLQARQHQWRPHTENRVRRLNEAFSIN